MCGDGWNTSGSHSQAPKTMKGRGGPGSVGNSGRKSKRQYRMLKALGLEDWKSQGTSQ